MGVLRPEYRDRVRHWMAALADDLYHEIAPVDFTGFRTFEHLTPEEAAGRDFVPVREGERWGETWEYLWLKARVTLPEAAQGRAVVMNLDLSGEATLFVNGEEFGTRRAEWVRTPHHFYEDNVLTRAGEAGAVYDLLFEVYAGHDFPGCATGPVMGGEYAPPDRTGGRAVVGHSGIGVWNADAYQLYMDAMTLWELLPCLPEESLRAANIADALEKFTFAVDFEQPPEARIRDYRAARAVLAPALAAENGDSAPRYYAVGNAHIDLAWLWPMRETFRKTARTFAQQLRLLDRYPEYLFIQSQPAAYEMCRAHYPKLYEKIRAAIKAGRWIAEGAMYVEPDTNMAGGEALIRQLAIGKRFYREEFGVESRMLWLPDTFGYTAALPQLLKGCGVRYLVTQKIFWSYNDGERFPYHYFNWRGMDGSEIVSFLPTSYTYHMDPKEMCDVWKSRAQTRNLDSFLIPFGYGDGGGGPCRDDIEYALRERNLEGAPRVEMASPVKLFSDLEEKGGPKDTWEGELYFSAHRGTYTSQASIKRWNRRNELTLREAEMWGALALARTGRAYPFAALTENWKGVLLHQFHDILPGSSIARVYEEARAAHEAIHEDVSALAHGAMDALIAGEGVTAFNSLPWARRAVVSLPDAFTRGAKTIEGEEIAVRGGAALVAVPPMGHVSLLPSDNGLNAPVARAHQADGRMILENDRIAVVFGERGVIESYVLKDTGAAFTGVMNRFEMFKDVPRTFDAWDIDSCYIDQPVALDGAFSGEIVTPEGVTAALRFRHAGEHSTIEQVVSLSAGATRVEFDTTVDWHELHRLLKVSFDAGVRSDTALNEMQFGFVRRPTHRSRQYDKDRFEVCNHRYTALCESGRGMAVLNDGKYGVSVNGSAVELTLLRAPAAPEMRADQGVHRFTYAFAAWEGAWLGCDAVRQGYELNVPVVLRGGSAPAFSAFSVDRDNVIPETVKAADDQSGDLIVRLYESKRTATDARLSVGFPLRGAALCDMLENPISPLPVRNGEIALRFTPFKVLTLRLYRS